VPKNIATCVMIEKPRLLNILAKLISILNKINCSDSEN
jgi:hypothetical protein